MDEYKLPLQSQAQYATDGIGSYIVSDLTSEPVEGSNIKKHIVDQNPNQINVFSMPFSKTPSQGNFSVGVQQPSGQKPPPHLRTGSSSISAFQH